mgnify:FL=1
MIDPEYSRYKSKMVNQPLEEHLRMRLPEPFKRKEPVPGGNDPCTCGSGKKYKKCCGRTSHD